MPIYTFDATDDESGGSYELVLRAVDLPQARRVARARGHTIGQLRSVVLDEAAPPSADEPLLVRLSGTRPYAAPPYFAVQVAGIVQIVIGALTIPIATWWVLRDDVMHAVTAFISAIVLMGIGQLMLALRDLVRHSFVIGPPSAIASPGKGGETTGSDVNARILAERHRQRREGGESSPP